MIVLTKQRGALGWPQKLRTICERVDILEPTRSAEPCVSPPFLKTLQGIKLYRQNISISLHSSVEELNSGLPRTNPDSSRDTAPRPRALILCSKISIQY